MLHAPIQMRFDFCCMNFFSLWLTWVARTGRYRGSCSQLQEGPGLEVLRELLDVLLSA